jgi:hypothetical protein
MAIKAFTKNFLSVVPVLFISCLILRIFIVYIKFDTISYFEAIGIFGGIQRQFSSDILFAK